MLTNRTTFGPHRLPANVKKTARPSLGSPPSACEAAPHAVGSRNLKRLCRAVSSVRVAKLAPNLARAHYPQLDVRTDSRNPTGHDIVVNATPMGMTHGDPLPVDIERVAPGTFVGEVVMKEEYTPLLRAAWAKGCPVQIGTDILFEMIPAYLEFFGFITGTPEELRVVSGWQY